MIGEWLITNFLFADDIVVNAKEEEEADVLVDRVDPTTKVYKMEIRQKARQKTQMTPK